MNTVNTVKTRLTLLLVTLLIGSYSTVEIDAADVAAVEEADRAFRVGLLMPVEGPVRRGVTIVVRQGHIASILDGDEAIPEGVKLTDLGADSVVVPTFVNPSSRIHELDSKPRLRRPRGAISGVAATPGDRRKAKGSASYQYRAAIYERLVETGYGAVALVPSGAAFLSGLATVIRPGKPGKDAKKEDSILLEDAYLGMSYRRGKTSRAGANRLFKKALDQIKKRKEAEKKKKEEEKKKAEAAKGGNQKKGAKPAPPKPAKASPNAAAQAAKPAPPPDPLVEVLDGKRKVFWLLSRDTANIDHAMRLFDGLETKFSFVLMTDPQEPDVVGRLAKRKERIRGVVLQPEMGRLYENSVYFHPAVLFEKAGLPGSFVPMSDDLEGHRDIFYFLAEMVKCGLGRDEALRAVTLNPARFLGIERRLGSLVVGKEASFVVYGADPFDGLARPRAVYHLGAQVFPAPKDDGSRAKAKVEVEQ